LPIVLPAINAGPRMDRAERADWRPGGLQWTGQPGQRASSMMRAAGPWSPVA